VLVLPARVSIFPNICGCLRVANNIYTAASPARGGRAAARGGRPAARPAARAARPAAPPAPPVPPVAPERPIVDRVAPGTPRRPLPSARKHRNRVYGRLLTTFRPGRQCPRPPAPHHQHHPSPAPHARRTFRPPGQPLLRGCGGAGGGGSSFVGGGGGGGGGGGVTLCCLL
jgi:uncharacterized membrane protein YgcG